MVLEGGVEPPRSFGAPDFESGASASSATPAAAQHKLLPEGILANSLTLNNDEASTQGFGIAWKN